MSAGDLAERTVRDIRRKTRKQYSAEEKIRIVISGLRGEESIAALCRREGIGGERHAMVQPTLAADEDLPRRPVDIVEPERDHLLGPQSEPRHHQQHRVIAATEPVVAVNRVD